MEERIQENKMGTMPIKKLLVTMAVPMMISMLVQALYNIVDSIFVSQINEYALTAVSLAFPLQNLIISFAVGIGVGINALLSRSLGEKDYERANLAAANGLLLEMLSYVIFLIIGIFFSETFMRAQTDIEEIIEYGTTYLRIVMIGSLGVFIEIAFERLLQSTGRTTYAMYTQLLGAIFNIIFDPILIFGWFGFPAMGIAGAAIATVGGQFAGAILGFILNHKKNTEISITFKSLRLKGRVVWDILRIGIPSIVMSSISSVMTFLMNLILVGFTSTAAAVFGVYFKLQSFVFMPVFGLNNGMVPIIAYNYGAKKPERIHQTIKLAMISATAIMVVGFGVFQLLPEQLLLMFNASEDMLEIGVPALRIISIHFVFAGISIISGSTCQAFGYGMYSLVISFVRQLVVLVPVAYFMSLTGLLDNVWYSFPISEAIAVACCVPLLLHVLKKTGMTVKKSIG